jgi:hypothetical protein
MSPLLRSEQPLAIIPSRACQQGGSHAAPLRRWSWWLARLPLAGTPEADIALRTHRNVHHHVTPRSWVTLWVTAIGVRGGAVVE